MQQITNMTFLVKTKCKILMWSISNVHIIFGEENYHIIQSKLIIVYI